LIKEAASKKKKGKKEIEKKTLGENEGKEDLNIDQRAPRKVSRKRKKASGRRDPGYERRVKVLEGRADTETKRPATDFRGWGGRGGALLSQRKGKEKRRVP